MKQIRLSRAFGTTPRSVYRRMEKAFSLPPEAGKEAAQYAELPARRPSHAWSIGLILLAILLLAGTAVLVLDPFHSAHPAQETAWLNEVHLEEITVRVRSASATQEDVSATVEFTGAAGQIAYFWYDGRELPEHFGTEAEEQPQYRVFCALGWQEAGSTVYSDLAAVQQERDALRVKLSGAWKRAAGKQKLTCYITVVHTQPDGSYQAEDVRRATLPLSVTVE